MITKEIIDIKDKPLAERLRLWQVLKDNRQELYNSGNALTNSEENDKYAIYSKSSIDWSGGGEYLKPTISLEGFIEKYKKDDKIRGLAFYKKSGENWTKKECKTIFNFVGDTGSTPNSLNTGEIYEYYSGDYYNWHDYNSNKENSIRVAYEDVFPKIKKKKVKSNNIKYNYPLYKQLKNGTVVKFTGFTEGVYIISAVYNSKPGDESKDFIPHTDDCWKDWKPQLCKDTILQAKTVAHCKTSEESEELLLWAEQNDLDVDGLNWEWHKENTCYELGGMSFYSHKSYWEEAGYTVLTMDEARNGVSKLLHQEWKDKFDVGVELEWSTLRSGQWRSMDDGTALLSFDDPLIIYREKQLKVTTSHCCEIMMPPLKKVKASEQKEKKMKFKVGDKVIATEDTYTGNRKGSIQIITEVDTDHGIIVSNTNNGYWTLGQYWELYDGASATTDTLETTATKKEDKMNLSKEDLIDVVRAAKGKKPKEVKVKTDLERAKKVKAVAIYHNEDGSFKQQINFTGKTFEVAATKAEDKLATKAFLGCSVDIFEFKSRQKVAVKLKSC